MKISDSKSCATMGRCDDGQRGIAILWVLIFLVPLLLCAGILLQVSAAYMGKANARYIAINLGIAGYRNSGHPTSAYNTMAAVAEVLGFAGVQANGGPQDIDADGVSDIQFGFNSTTVPEISSFVRLKESLLEGFLGTLTTLSSVGTAVVSSPPTYISLLLDNSDSLKRGGNFSEQYQAAMESYYNAIGEAAPSPLPTEPPLALRPKLPGFFRHVADPHEVTARPWNSISSIREPWLHSGPACADIGESHCLGSDLSQMGHASIHNPDSLYKARQTSAILLQALYSLTKYLGVVAFAGKPSIADLQNTASMLGLSPGDLNSTGAYELWNFNETYQGCPVSPIGVTPGVRAGSYESPLNPYVHPVPQCDPQRWSAFTLGDTYLRKLNLYATTYGSDGSVSPAGSIALYDAPKPLQSEVDWPVSADSLPYSEFTTAGLTVPSNKPVVAGGASYNWYSFQYTPDVLKLDGAAYPTKSVLPPNVGRAYIYPPSQPACPGNCGVMGAMTEPDNDQYSCYCSGFPDADPPPYPYPRTDAQPNVRTEFPSEPAPTVLSLLPELLVSLNVGRPGTDTPAAVNLARQRYRDFDIHFKSQDVPEDTRGVIVLVTDGIPEDSIADKDPPCCGSLAVGETVPTPLCPSLCNKGVIAKSPAQMLAELQSEVNALTGANSAHKAIVVTWLLNFTTGLPDWVASINSSFDWSSWINALPDNTLISSGQTFISSANIPPGSIWDADACNAIIAQQLSMPSVPPPGHSWLTPRMLMQSLWSGFQQTDSVGYGIISQMCYACGSFCATEPVKGVTDQWRRLYNDDLENSTYYEQFRNYMNNPEQRRLLFQTQFSTSPSGIIPQNKEAWVRGLKAMVMAVMQQAQLKQ